MKIILDILISFMNNKSMTKCKVSWCYKQMVANSYCQNHLTQITLRGKIGKPKPKSIRIRYCSVESCNNDHYAKGYCHKHYEKFCNNKHRRHCHPCAIEGCKRKALNKYCGYHTRRLNYRLQHNLSTDLTIKCTIKGKRNPRWSGGTSSYYKNHYELKKARKAKLLEVGYKCQICNMEKEKLWIFHLDRNKDNHAPSNLILVCLECRYSKFPYSSSNSRHPYNSKFRKQYGMSLHEIKEKYHKPISAIRKLHQRNELANLLVEVGV